MKYSKQNFTDGQVLTADCLNTIEHGIDCLCNCVAAVNLFDNSDFRNPVNQRGATTCNHTQYGLDRWIFSTISGYGTVSFVSGASGTLFTCSDGDLINIMQIFEDSNYYEGKYTAVLKTSDGNLKFGSVNPQGLTKDLYRAHFWIINDTTVVWAALYEGQYTAETLPEYQPNGYGAELTECMRYYQIHSTNNVAAVDMRPPMRMNSPTVTEVTGGYAYSADF